MKDKNPALDLPKSGQSSQAKYTWSIAGPDVAKCKPVLKLTTVPAYEEDSIWLLGMSVFDKCIRT